MARVRILILRAAGTNCDLETEHAWQSAGAEAERVHVRRLIENPRLLDEAQVLTIPGGFSYGDDIAAGRIFAAQLERHLSDPIRRFVDAGGLVLGICNGFQVLVKAGLLPFSQSAGSERVCTVTYNDPLGFQDCWVRLRGGRTPCVFLQPDREYELPIAHGEGRVVFDRRADAALGPQHHALFYVPAPEADDGAAYNPNGSHADVAGLCDETGRVLGLMPHPERFVTFTQHPRWTAGDRRDPGDGLAMFQRAVAHLS